MPLLLVFAFLLSFPFIELYLLISLGSEYGWWLALYLLTAMAVGFLLIRREQFAVSAQLFQNIRAGQHPVILLFSSAKKMLAGMLLIFPGVISDFIAVLLLLIPVSSNSDQKPNKVTPDDDVIEGEWRRED